jgi:hypothetical protein
MNTQVWTVLANPSHNNISRIIKMTNADEDLVLFDPDLEHDPDLAIKEYDIVSSPNDFNVLSYFNFIESGAIVIPGFQRHYVWDIRKASKLIESILMGLPIPQIFLYEQAKNKFLVIDGQQRLMTIYYFMKGRFPKRDARTIIRSIFTEKGKLEPVDLENDSLFSGFKLSFSTDGSDGSSSPYSGMTYAGLDKLMPTFQLRTIRNIMVKQVNPDNDNSSVFELFHRLNTGGINLSQQEIRMSLYYGPFMRTVTKWNDVEPWRTILGGNPDQRQKDTEIILRMFALADRHEKFKKPLTKFINDYCSDLRGYADEDEVYGAIFTLFCSIISEMERNNFLEPKSKRISVPILEALFVASTESAIRNKDVGQFKRFDGEVVKKLRQHEDFETYFTGKTTDVEAVRGRISVAKTVMQ